MKDKPLVTREADGEAPSYEELEMAYFKIHKENEQLKVDNSRLRDNLAYLKFQVNKMSKE